jgi:predicted GNAT family acetyltransferase
MRGRGIASELAQGALELIRADGDKSSPAAAL